MTRRVASEAVDEAIRQIVSGVKLPARPRGIKEGKGRPMLTFTAEQMKDAKAVWRNVKDYPTWEDAEKALPEDFTRYRAYKLWGKRQ